MENGRDIMTKVYSPVLTQSFTSCVEAIKFTRILLDTYEFEEIMIADNYDQENLVILYSGDELRRLMINMKAINDDDLMMIAL